MQNLQKILGTGMKTEKGERAGYLTAVSYLLPNKDICKGSSKECLKSCLKDSGRLVMPNVRTAMKRKSDLYQNDIDLFKASLINDIGKHEKKAIRKGLIPVVRINGTSDIDVQSLGVIEQFPNVQFYDYTKLFDRYSHESNYHLTYSFDGHNLGECVKKLMQGLNVAMVFNCDELPKSYKGFPVIDGDKDDLRFLDGFGAIVGLKVKGKAKKYENAFIINLKGGK